MSCQSYLIAAIFALLSSLAFTRATSQPRVFLPLSWCCFCLAAFSKAATVPLPAVFLCMDAALFKTSAPSKSYIRALVGSVLKLLPFFVVSMLASYFAIQANKGQAVPNKLCLSEKVLWSTYSVCWYIWKSILPSELSVLYPFPPDGFPSSNVWFVGAFLATVGGAVIAAMPLFKGQALGYTALCWLSFLVVIPVLVRSALFWPLAVTSLWT